MIQTALRYKYKDILPHLNERQRRLMVAADAKVLGYGGITLTHKASGLARSTIHQAIKELELEPTLPVGRNREPGGGRKLIEVEQPGITKALSGLVKPTTRGDPQSPLRWTIKSTRELT